ncbi:MAG: carboxylating nicotinate-nucleotide diphosphorylase [Chitinispirillales bacterium]|nr:carboxylating nicotinate-nucleotide diphosphorylase [Chitinispirillales bacterium]
MKAAALPTTNYKVPQLMFDIIPILKNALEEDLGSNGDITSMAIFDERDKGEALIRSKQVGVLSGETLIKPLFELVDTSVQVESYCTDGEALEPGKVICKVRGSVRAILTGERTILNLLQHLSGIATMTAGMVKLITGSKCKLLDTRKTTPGLRALEKAAVLHGGGYNHRFGLFDMILIKDTHVKRAGGVRKALKKAFLLRAGKEKPLIEVEVQSIDEFNEALALGPDRIMLDNMTLENIEICVTKRNAVASKTKLEASGNITSVTISSIAATGIDFVSCGSLTHSAPAIDINLVMI